MPIELSPMVHIEIVVRDAEAAYQFLHDALGAEKVQEEFAGFLDSDRKSGSQRGHAIFIGRIRSAKNGGCKYERI